MRRRRGHQQRLPRVGAEHRRHVAHRRRADAGPVPTPGGHRDLVMGRPAGAGRTQPVPARAGAIPVGHAGPSDGVRLAVLLQFPPTGPTDSISDTGGPPAGVDRTDRAHRRLGRRGPPGGGGVPGSGRLPHHRAAVRPATGTSSPGCAPRRGPGSGPASSTTPTCAPTARPSSVPWSPRSSPRSSIWRQAKPGWEFGPWTQDPRYNDPPGACPDDQPPGRLPGLRVPDVPGRSAAGIPP